MLKRLIRDRKKNIYRTGGCSRRNRAGFTMAEVLMVVAIIGILAAIAAPAAGTIQKRMRQTELDSKAEIIYTAAQNRISEMKAGAADGILQPGTPGNNITRYVDASGALSIPGDADPSEVEDGSLYFFTKDETTPGTAGESVMVTGLIEQDLLNQIWIVEFNPETGMVYSVFYSEKETDLISRYKNSGTHLDELRDKSVRLAAGATVGYYRGNTGSAKRAATLKPHIEIHNEDTLTVDIWCDRPSDIGSTNHLAFLVTIEDAYGHAYSKWYTIDGKRGEEDGHDIDLTGQLTKSGFRYSMTLTLDDLSATDNSKRFYNLYGEGNTSRNVDERLVSGTNITVTARVFCPGDTRVDKSRPVTDESNSLYDFDTGNTKTTAYITNTRHLQNLEWEASHNADIDTARQTADIDFHVDGSGTEWFDESVRGFTPIVNSALKSYLVDESTETDSEGNTVIHHPVITGLTVNNTTGNAGLFGALYGGQKVQGVYLTGMTVNGRYAGSVAGTVEEGDRADKAEGVTLNGCRCYLEESDYKNTTYTNAWNVPARIDGEDAGGLIGRLSSGKLYINDSLASSMVGHITLAEGGSVTSDRSASVGGLIGRVSGGEAHLSTSYADCYLRGTNMGGLVGISNAKAVIADCYSAGYVYMYDGSKGAGIGLPENTDFTMNRSYTIMTRQSKGETETGSYYATAPKGSGAYTYYLEADHHPGDDATPIGELIAGLSPDDPAQVIPALLSNLGSEFQTDDMDTVAYNLLDQGLTAYKHPMLKDVALHYGDWSSAFQSGALVYYEKYAYEDENGNTVEFAALSDKFDSDNYPVNEYGYSSGAGISATLEGSEITVEGHTYRVYVIGDGYAVIYLTGSEPADTDSITYTITGSAGADGTSGTVYPSANGPYTSRGKDGNTYKLYPLPKEANNITPSSGNFYMQIDIDRTGAARETYYFNPHFANTVSGSPSQVENHGVTIRTPRHLYLLSKYFPDYYYRTIPAAVTYYQERNADYAEYDWSGYYGGSAITVQDPIGDDTHHFKSTYDGGCNWISNVSIVAQSSTYVGFFAYNEGTIKDTVLTVEYSRNDAGSHRIQRKGNVNTNQNVYMGTICGYNKGEITNTAVSGYYIAGREGTIFAYSSSNLRTGGFVGGNAGTIKNCSADCPEIRVSPTYAKCWLGGFTGRNTGTIRACYALGHIEVVQPKEGSIKLAGFAAANSGSITKSYCATALTGSGSTTTSYGFSPTDGSVSGCYYLNDGTYTYIGRMYAYDFDSSKTAGVPKEQDEIKAKANESGDLADEYHTFSFKNTKSLTGAYPYTAVVREKNSDGRYGAFVHYGDWQNDVVMGVCGLFYWEKEEAGSNNGIHITYLGYDSDSTSIPYVTGTSLCTAHDDGGIITSYGYGYYKRKTNAGATLTNTLTGLAYSDGTYNTEVAASLENQISDYDFYPYTTPNPFDTTNYNSLTGDYIWFSGGSDALNTNYGIWKMKYGSKTINFKLAPYFANAMSVTTGSGEDVQIPTGEEPVLSKDLIDTDFSTQQGTDTNHYEIRSLEQLQYINWNFGTKNALTIADDRVGVSGGITYKNYSYLQHATFTNSGTQKRSEVEAVRASEYFRQSHDLDGSSVTGHTYGYAPIAGMRNISSPTDYSYALLTWFGGTYDGQSYTIKNVAINSKCPNVGLFGTTVGATLENIIMYSDKGSVIQRETELSDGYSSYMLGGLVGNAYDYNGASTDHVITNCAIAGYTIADYSKNQQSLGEANIGGLLGSANVNLRNCSAVVNIIVGPYYGGTDRNGVFAQYGNYLRIGGLAGNLKNEMVNCYTGGSIRIEKWMLYNYDPVTNSNGWNEENIKQEYGGNVQRKHSHIYIGGMAGNGGTSNPRNFTGKSGVADGDMIFKNCYTYMTFPKMTGRIRAISMMGSVADRYANSTVPDQTKNPKIYNCYYLQGREPAIDETYVYHDTRRFSGSTTYTLKQLLDEEYKQNGETRTVKDWMLRGNLRIAYQLGLHDYNNVKDKGIQKDLTAVSYEVLSDPNMKNLLNAGPNSNNAWANVTVTEGEDNASVDGKYSFGANNPALIGKNYPFPTVIKQRDLIFASSTTPSINVHYGEWLLTDIYWSHGRASMDIFDNIGKAGYPADGFAYETYKLYDTQGVIQAAGGLSVSDFTVHAENSDQQIAQIASVTWNETDKAYDVVVKALNVGSVQIYPTNMPAYDFSLDITANLEVTATPAEMALVRGDANKQLLTLSALSMGDGNGNDRKDYSTVDTTAGTPRATEKCWSVATAPANYLHAVQRADAVNKWDIIRDSYERSSDSPIIIGVTYYYYYNGVELPFSAQATVTYPSYNVAVVLNVATNGGHWSGGTGGTDTDPRTATTAFDDATKTLAALYTQALNGGTPEKANATFTGWQIGSTTVAFDPAGTDAAKTIKELVET
ncbi:MAG: prepilin-type N-terminal cleavage/methylation domain-containing protein, partial [Lachnospiraceae bacterium]|nr:prepilin-type N-terminal cleavage/methylation domain-containing protein [Lachnospiraceae bacterium]